MFSQAQLPGNRLADSSSSRISSSSAAQSLSPNTTSQHSRTSSPANDYLGLSRKPDYRSQSRDSGSPSLNTSRAVIDITRETILQAFLPHVAVYASADTEELIRLKGIYGGFRGILRPFGEKIPGRIVIRDSVGASRNCENFGIYFVEPGPKSGVHSSYTKGKEPDNGVEASNYSKISSIATSVGTIIPTLDEVVDHYVRNEESFKSVAHGQSYPFSKTTSPREGASPAYLLYLRKLLASRPMVPHETFAQPVACIVAISSQSPAPIETLRDLYNDTRQGIRRVPLWAGNEYLRYYVLIHDEENDDITKSTALFEQMKRHFGLHCHLLRLRSTECLPTDDDSTKLPTCKWLNADEELVHLQWHGMWLHAPERLFTNSLQTKTLMSRTSNNISLSPMRLQSGLSFVKWLLSQSYHSWKVVSRPGMIRWHRGEGALVVGSCLFRSVGQGSALLEALQQGPRPLHCLLGPIMMSAMVTILLTHPRRPCVAWLITPSC